MDKRKISYQNKWNKAIYGFILLILSLGLYHCTNTDQVQNYSFAKVGKSSFPIDTLTKSMQFNVQSFQDTLIVLNSDYNALLFYSISQEKFLYKINFKKEGENGISAITGFLYHNADSIFLLSAYQYKLYLFNKKGILIDKYNLLKNEKVDVGSALAVGNMFSKMEKINDEIHISTIPYLKPESKEFYSSKKIHQVLDLKTKEYRFLPITYSDTYQKNAYPSAFFIFHRCYNPKKQIFVYSFMADDKLMATDGKKVSYHNAVYEQMSKPLKLKNFTFNEDEHKKVQDKSNQYLMILYDPYRDVYYRIAQQMKDINKIVWAIVVLDNNLKKILEKHYRAIDKNLQNNNNFLPPFVAEKGLYLPNGNSSTEDFFEMDIYTLSKKE